MAENPYVNKVIYGDQTLIDLTDDTVSPSSLKLGSTAHDASGAQITGTADDAPKRTLAYIFDSSDSYAVSDYVYYEDKLYRCIVAHSGTWNSEHFVETTIGDELNDKMAGMTILSYGTSTWNDFLTAYTGNKVVYCRASSNANPATGSQTRLAFMAYVNNATNPTNVEFQYYRSVSSHTASQQGDQVYVYKLDKTAGWTVTTREASSKIVAGTNMSSSYSNGTLTLNATDTTYESKAAASGGTDLSLVTTGEKYNWNARGVPSGGTSGQVLKKSSATDYATRWADLNENPIINVYLDNTENPPRYYVSNSDIQDVVEITDSFKLVTLNYVKDSFTGAMGDGSEESFEQYHLSDVHSVTTYDENEGTYSMKFHFVFINEEMSSSGSKIKKFELVDDAFTYDNLLNATVTYSEELLSSGGVNYVTFTVNKSPYSCTADKTYQEVKAGLDNGEIYFALINGDYFTGTKPLVWNLDGYDTSSIHFSRRNITTGSSSYDVSIAYEHVILLSNGTASTTTTYDHVAKPVDFRGYLRLSCNDDYYYQDNPSGTFKIECSDDFYTMESVYLAIHSRFSEDVRLVYGQVDNSSPPAKYEIYHLAEATYEEVDPEDQGYGVPKYTLVFKVLSEKNGVPVLKKVIAVGVDTDEQWDGIGISSNRVTVTYSEISLGAPPSASGVSF